ncbi:uncharacterized protein LOC113298807 isoform X2 [Papaver somniferum]|uniref:uncharacterized protein LOC113298807 isoform X2 n=1 Tax=Papaver somniferum TaxID=3469 RepID=UPI000E6F6052|nr:uncharacterized protein LOC113298807 isoform X2 [Papaver somniferum]
MAESLRSPPEELNSVRIEDLISFDDCDDCDDGLLDYSIRDHIDFNDSLINQGEAPDGEAHTLNTSVGEVADAGEACGLLQGSVGRGNDKANTNDNELDSLINQGEVPGGEAHTLDTSVGEVADAGEACGLLQGSVGRGNDKELDSLINQGKYLVEKPILWTLRWMKWLMLEKPVVCCREVLGGGMTLSIQMITLLFLIFTQIPKSRQLSVELKLLREF